MSDIAVLNLDGTVLESKEELHNTVFYQLALPDYYGRNLDALWDVLSTWSAPLCIEVTHTELLKRHLTGYADALLELLHDAAAENNTITLIIS